MTKTGILCVVLVMFSGTAGMLYGKDAGAADDWNRLTASPSYGFNAALFPLTYGPDDTETALFMPGVELRHFNGINVTRGGGFYYGYEIGASANVFLGSRTFAIGADSYTLRSAYAASLFLMGKHGYRWRFGDGERGAGIGLEIGLGIMAGGGSIEFVDDSDSDLTYSSGEEVFSPALELGADGFMRLSENLRVNARLSLLAGIPLVSIMDDLGIDVRGDMVPVRLSLRLGFIRDHKGDT